MSPDRASRGAAPAAQPRWAPVPDDVPPPAGMQRLRPTRSWGVTYLRGVLVFLGLFAAALLLNVFVPLGKGSLGKLSFTFFVLAAAWAVALLLPIMARLRGLQPATAALAPALPVLVVLVFLSTWGIGPPGLGRWAGAVALAVLTAFGLGPAWSRLSRGLDAVPAGLGAIAIASGGIVLALAVAGLGVDERLVESGWRGALAMVFASAILLAPLRRPAARLLAWGGFLCLGLAGLVDPWVAGDLGTRVNVAGLGLLLVLGLAALTATLLPERRRA